MHGFGPRHDCARSGWRTASRSTSGEGLHRQRARAAPADRRIKFGQPAQSHAERERQCALGLIEPNHCKEWQRRTNVWREVTSPAQDFRRLRSDRQRGAIAPALANLSRPVAGQRCRSFNRRFAGRAEAKHELVRPVFLPRRGVAGFGLRMHSAILPAKTAGSRAETLERQGGRSAIAEGSRSAIAAEVPEGGSAARRSSRIDAALGRSFTAAPKGRSPRRQNKKVPRT